MIRSISRPDGYAPSVALWIGAMTESRDDLLEILADLTHEELHRRLLPGAHSIAEILWHLANVELWWMQAVILGQEVSVEQQHRFGLTEPGELNCPPGDWELERFTGLMAEAHALTQQVLGAMDEQRFSSPICRIPGRERRITPEWIAYNLLDHIANHRGQVALIKRLLRTDQEPAP